MIEFKFWYFDLFYIAVVFFKALTIVALGSILHQFIYILPASRKWSGSNAGLTRMELFWKLKPNWPVILIIFALGIIAIFI